MPTTTKMGIVYPASTDLVKDGATAMGTISTTVDAKTGDILINTTAFTAQSTVSLNNVFSANFKNYTVVIRGVQSAQVGFAYRVRASGTDLTTSTYQYSNIFHFSNSASATVDSFNTATSIDLLGGGSNGFYYILEFNNPFEASRTIIQNNGSFVTGNPYTYNIKGTANVANTTSYDGFSLIPASGTITGSVSVYGRNE